MKNALLFALVCFLFTTITAQTRYYVNGQADSTIANGQSWATAFTHPQHAFDLASHGDEIWIANGVYRPMLNEGRKSTFMMEKPLRVYGGFVGNETSIIERNIQTLGTTFSGEVGDTTKTDNLFTILTLDNCDTTTVFDGIVFERGYAMEDTITVQGYYGPAHCGGAIYVKPDLGFSKPTFRYCTFRQNTAEFGGAIFTFSPDSAIDNNPAFYHCNFEENYAVSGNSIYIISSGNSPLIFKHCNFLNNFSVYEGCMFLLHEKDSFIMEIDSCNFTSNMNSLASFPVGMSIEYKHKKNDRFIVYSFTNSRFDRNHHASLVNPGIHQSLGFIDYYSRIAVSDTTASRIAQSVVFKNNTLQATGFDFDAFVGYLDTSTTIESFVTVLDNQFENAQFAVGGSYNMQIENNQLYKSVMRLIPSHKFEHLLFQNNHLDSSILTLNYNSSDTTETSLSEIVNSIFSGSAVSINSNNRQPNRVIYFANNFLSKAPVNVKETRFCQNVIDSCIVQLSESSVIGNTFKVSQAKGVAFYNTVLNNIFFKSYVDTVRQFFERARNFDNNFINVNVGAIDTTGFGKNNFFTSSQLTAGVFQSVTSTITANCARFKNLGVNTPLQVLNTDFRGKPRRIECAVDIGAYEIDSTVIDSFQINPACTNGVNDGAIFIATQPSCNGNVKIQWIDPMGGGPNLSTSGLFAKGPGLYTLSITLSPGCPANVIDTVIQIPSYTTTVSNVGDTVIHCGSAIGADIIMQPLGGIEPYVIFWSDTTLSGFQLNNLSPGLYPFQLFDKFSCRVRDTLQIGVSGSLPILASAESPTCFGEDDGWLCLQPLAGKAPFQWEWQQVSGDSMCAEGLVAGQYTCSISDAFGCLSVQTLNLNQPAEISLLSAITHTLSGLNTGEIQIFSVQGGIPPYAFLWSTSDTTNTISNLSPGLYTVTLSDANGCLLTNEFQVELISSVANVTQFPKEVKVWPNPFQQFFFIDLTGEEFYLYSAIGERVNVSIDRFDRFTRISTSELPPGVYTWHCQGQSGKVLRL